MSQPKRQVSYNQDAVLCHFCRKRIRLNNNGRLRVHVSGKAGSAKCMGSDDEPRGSEPVSFADIDNSMSPEAKPLPAQIFQKEDRPPLWTEPLFSDIQ